MLLFVVDTTSPIVTFLAGKLLCEVSALSPSFQPLAAGCNLPCFVVARFCRTIEMIWITKLKPKSKLIKTSKFLFSRYYVICWCVILTSLWIAISTHLAKHKVTVLVFAGFSVSLIPEEDHINSKLTKLHVQLWCFMVHEISWNFACILHRAVRRQPEPTGRSVFGVLWNNI